MKIYGLWRNLSGERELVALSMSRRALENRLVQDIQTWTLPVEYELRMENVLETEDKL